MKKFSIVNPIIQGSLDTSFEAKTPMDAAVKAYKNVSAYFSSNVPQFAFTMKEGNSFYHYVATEKINGDGKIKFTIKENKNVPGASKLPEFISGINDMKGGKYKKYRYNDDSSDSSDSSNDSSSDYNYYRPVKRRSPIDYWYYNPNVYARDHYYVPQFISSITPYVYITLES
jgi:hypothetical protein